MEHRCRYSPASAGADSMFTMTMVFACLKIAGEISWSWWWVTAPLWVGALFYIMLLVVWAGYLIIAEIVDKWPRKRRK